VAVFRNVINHLACGPEKVDQKISSFGTPTHDPSAMPKNNALIGRQIVEKHAHRFRHHACTPMNALEDRMNIV
jgi:hypothetical protein